MNHDSDARTHHEHGLRLRADGRLREAAAAFARALAYYPPWVAAAYELGRTHEQLDELTEAREAYLEAYRLDPEPLEAVLLAAAVSERLGDWRDAAAAYQLAMRLDPEHADAASHWAYAQERAAAATASSEDDLPPLEWPPMPRASAAIVLHRRASSDEPGRAGRSGPAHRAIAAYRKMVDDDPDHLAALLGLASTLRSAGRMEEARARFHQAGARLQLLVDDTRGVAGGTGPAALPHFDAGVSFLAESRFAESVRALHKAVRAAPDSPEPWYLLALALIGDGRPVDALAALEQVRATSPSHRQACRDRAALLHAAGQVRRAVSAYEDLLALDPDDVGALVARADALRHLDELDAALAGYDAALAIDDEHLGALSGRAAVLGRLGRTRDALAAWEVAEQCNPHDAAIADAASRCRQLLARDGRPEPDGASETAPPDDSESRQQEARDTFDRGRSFVKDRDYGSAIECFRRALDLDPSFVDASFRLGLALEDDRQFRIAIASYKRCLELQPDHVQAATNIGEALRKNERYAEAVTAYDHALAIRTDYLYALAGRAESMRMLGRYEECLPWFDRALAVGPRHAFAIQGKAAALNALRRFEESQELWDLALQIDPRSQFALDGKAYCEARLQHSLGVDDDDMPDDEPVSSTPTLDEQGRDLTALARAGQLDDVIGREREIRAVMKTLVRRQKANPLLLGDPGVGKTAIVEGVAAALARDDAPARLGELRIVELSMGSLLAGTKYRGTFEERMKSVVQEVRDNPDVVLFIDEIHTLVGTGRTEGGSLDAANLLKPALARGEIRVIGATTISEYRKHIEPDAALERRFHPIQVEEPTAAETEALLTAVQERYATHHGVRILPAALTGAVVLAQRFLPDRRFPDKALDLLDEACAEASLDDEPTVSHHTVARVVAERTGIGVGDLTIEERSRLETLSAKLTARVVGQDRAVAALTGAVRRARAGLRDPNRPRGVFLFAGPSGVGKTELAKSLADVLFPEGQALVRLDMSEYGDRFTASRLVGAPPGYAGHGEEGQLTGQLRRRPYAVVLLDEFEKAHPDVQAMFLSLFEEGELRDADGRRVDAREAWFVITTNAGSSGGSGGSVGFKARGRSPEEDTRESLRSWFRVELLNRFDAVIRFDALDPESMRRIVQIHLGRIADRAAIHGVEVSWTDAVVAWCAQRASDASMGARPALRAVEEFVSAPVGDAILDASGAPRRVRLRVRQDEVVLEVRPASPGARREEDDVEQPVS